MVLSGTYHICEDVFQSRTGFIVAPDFDNDGLYDLNVDCLWTVEAPGDHVIQFRLHFVYMESSVHCQKDLLQVCTCCFCWSINEPYNSE